MMSYMICKSIYNYKSAVENRDKENILLVLEEAHRYISANSSDHFNNYYVEKVAREGRKFGVNLLVSTQRPSEVSNTVISQCNSLIVHKITNNKDLEFIRNTIQYDDKSQIDLLTSLKPQEALVLGEAFAFSALIRIAEADPLPYSETPNIF
jgi:DNA helicase HerA-like ATPase